jgi:hypothetical protein
MNRDIPWKGRNYSATNRFGFRLLIVGESVYHDKSSPNPAPSGQNLIKWVLNGMRKQFYTNIYQVVGGIRKAESTREQVDDFWHSVAFTNYIVEPVAATARKRPTDDMWVQAKEPFVANVMDLKPEGILVLGFALWNTLCYLGVVHADKEDIYAGEVILDGVAARARRVKHPSAGFSTNTWKPKVAVLLEECRVRKASALPPL